MHNAVCAVIVTHHPGGEIADILAALLPQVQRVYIVDNGSREAARKTLEECRTAHPEIIELVLNDSNLGLAAAQNQGIRLAVAVGFEWVLLLDDDSLPAPDMVERLLSAWRKQSDRHIGIVAPRLVERGVPAPVRYVVPYGVVFRRKSLRAGDNLTGVAMVIASGSLIRTEVFHAAGLMNEGFFIDGVDHEFCLRARRLGYTILVTGDAVLTHRQGEKRLTFFGMAPSGHSAARRYTIFRNRIFLLRRYARHFPFLPAYETMACFWDLARILLAEPNKKEKLSAAFRGLAHGMTRPVPEPEALQPSGANLVVTVGIVTFHTPLPLLEATLASLKTCTLSLEITIVDNTPGTDYFSTLQALPQVRLMHSPANRGYGAGHNLAFKASAQAPYHLILNPDVELKPGCLETLVAMMEKEPDIGLAVPQIHYPDGTLQPLNRRDPTVLDLFLRRFVPRRLQQFPHIRRRMEYYTMVDTGYDRPCDVPNASGCFMLLRRPVFEALAGFDERFFMYFEDADLSRRARALARVRYCPEAHIIHRWTRGSHTSLRLTLATLVSAGRYFGKWGWRWR